MFAGTTAMTFRSELLLLYAARGVRGFGDGFAVIILPAYLSAIGFTPVEIGIVATAALLGSSLLTLAVGFVAPRHDLRTMLLLGAALMVATGIVFPAGRAHRVRAAGRVRRHHQSAVRRRAACWCRWSTRCWRAASPTPTARARSRATA